MEKKILRILSFVMIAMFAVTCMGLSIGAEEEIDIPVIEEITEEEMTEELPEEEVELYSEGTVAMIGETPYDSLDGALAVAEDGTQIDIVGVATLTDAEVTNKRFLVKDGAALTITGGTVTDYNGSDATIEAESGATITLNGVAVTENYNSAGTGAVFMRAGSKLYIDGNTNVTNNRTATLLDGDGKLRHSAMGKYHNIRLEGADILIVKEDFTGSVGLMNIKLGENDVVSADYCMDFALAEEGYQKAGTIFHDEFGGTVDLASGNLSWEAECKIDDTEYPFLEAAFATLNSSSDVKITLLKNISINEHDGYINLSYKGKIVIDGGSESKYTITCIGLDKVSAGSPYAGMTPEYIVGSILINNTEVTATNVNFRRNGQQRAYGFFRFGGAGKLTLSDYAVIGGTENQLLKSSNGGAVFMEAKGAVFVMDGEGAKIEYTSGGWGTVVAFSIGSEVYIKKGTIENNTSTAGAVNVRSGAYAEITGGTINHSAKALSVEGSATVTGGDIGSIVALNAGKITMENITTGDVTLTSDASKKTAPEITMTDVTVGTVTLDDNTTGVIPKVKLSGKINATGITMTIPDGIVLSGNVTTDVPIPVTISTGTIRFGTTEDVSFTGAQCFVDATKTVVKGRRYVPGTTFPNDAAKSAVEARNAGKENALIFDYGFVRVLDTETDIFNGKGYGRGIAKAAGDNEAQLNGAFATGYTVYMLKDISCYKYVYESSQKIAINGVETTIYNHSNIAGASPVKVLDGNGFTMIGDGSGDENNDAYDNSPHVFRIFPGAVITFNNFTFDGNGFKKLLNGEYVNASYSGGHITFNNSLIKNTLNGAVSVSDSTLTINNTRIEECQSGDGGSVYVGPPKISGGSTVVNIVDSSVTGCSASKNGALVIGAGTTVNMSGNNIISDNVITGTDTAANVWFKGEGLLKVTGALSGHIGISNDTAGWIGSLNGGSVAEGTFVGDRKYTSGAYSIYYPTAAKWVSYTTTDTMDVIEEDGNFVLVNDCYLNEDGIRKSVSIYKALSTVQEGDVIHLVRDIDLANVRNDQTGWNIAGMRSFTINGHGKTIKVGEKVTNTYEGESATKPMQINIQLYGTGVAFENVVFDGQNNSGTSILPINAGAVMQLKDSIIKNYTYTSGDGSGLISINVCKHDANTDKTTVYSSEVIMDNTKIINCSGSTNGNIIRIAPATNYVYTDGDDLRQLVINNCEFSDITSATIIKMSSDTKVSIAGSVFSNADVSDDVLALYEGANVTMSDVTITDCVSNSNVGGAITAVAGSKLTINGKANITGNKKIDNGAEVASNIIIGDTGVLTLGADFTGKIGVTDTTNASDLANKAFGTTVLTSVESVESITNDANPDIFGYATGTNVVWKELPKVTVNTDHGWYYASEDENAAKTNGTARFLVKFENMPEGVETEYYGIYLSSMKGSLSEQSKTVKFANTDEGYKAPAAGKAFIADVINIEPENIDRTVYGMSYIKLKNIDAPIMLGTYSRKLTSDGKNLGVAA